MTNDGLGGWPARRALMTPERTAIVYQDKPMTYGEFFTRTTKVASRLRASGIEKGDRVGYLGPNHPAWVEMMFAAHMLGAIFVPLNFRLTTPELEYMIADAGVEIIVRDPSTAEVTGAEIISLDSYESWLEQGSDEPIEVAVTQDEVAFILYTSGTTGRPKGAMLSHANQIWNTYNVLVSFDVAGDEVSLISAPLFHVAALGQSLLPTFIKGGCSVLTPTWNADLAFDLIESYRITWVFGVTTMFASLVQSPRWATADLSSLRSLMSGGAPIPVSLIETYQQRGLVFQQGYGLTETSPGATMLEARQSVRKAGSAGVPVFFTSVRVDAPPGKPGEVLIKGPNVTPGYWNNPVATEAAFDDGWFHSGDLATVDDEGYLYIVDRVKDMYISGGENVYPAEVEGVIFGHPAVAEVAVIGVPDPKWGEVGKAFVVCRPGAELTDLPQFLGTRLAKYKIPVYVEVVPDLPRTASGKVQKAKLRLTAQKS